MKWSGVPFTHIYVWKIRSPYLGSFGSSSWNFLVEMVPLGSSSMIHLPFSGLKSKFESTSDPGDFVSSNNDCLEPHSSVLFQGILWNSYHFPVSFFEFPLPFFFDGLGWLSWCWTSFLCPFSRGLVLGMCYILCTTRSTVCYVASGA
jgi:hypothetical protein